jgi:transposase InsO family protein
LCFVPASHEEEVKLPAVSGSSGRLIVERAKVELVEPDYPGLVFADESLDYSEAMHQFVVARQTKDNQPAQVEIGSVEVEKADLKAQKQALRREKEALSLSRRHIRDQRHQEDAAWQALKHQHRGQQVERKAHLSRGHSPTWGSQKAHNEQWDYLRQQRQAQLKQRDHQDQQWRQQRAHLRQQALELPLITVWIAILVVTDNCTRQCLGLPLFVAGNNVTAELVVAALRCLLPPELQFLISDRGTHFTAQIFQQLAKKGTFIHVPIARHRPQSNGIAERFVRTLKEWLADKSWQSEPELSQLINQFLAEYNNRPHQGLPIPGLSPNELAKRIWLF